MFRRSLCELCKETLPLKSIEMSLELICLKIQYFRFCYKFLLDFQFILDVDKSYLLRFLC